MKLIPTILCGGAGSRLWPVSREQHTKSFIRFVMDQAVPLVRNGKFSYFWCQAECTRNW